MSNVISNYNVQPKKKLNHKFYVMKIALFVMTDFNARSIRRLNSVTNTLYTCVCAFVQQCNAEANVQTHSNAHYIQSIFQKFCLLFGSWSCLYSLILYTLYNITSKIFPCAAFFLQFFVLFLLACSKNHLIVCYIRSK